MKTILGVSLAALLLAGNCQTETDELPAPIDPTEAASKINEEVRVQMKVNSASIRSGMCFLNSAENFKDEKNFTIFISREVMAKFKEKMVDDPAAHFKGKTIVVKGKVTLYRDRPQIALSEPAAIKIRDQK